MKHKDERAKLTDAILSNIKVIKLYGWEKTFMEKLLGIRKQELQALKRSQILFSASLVSFHSSTFLVSGSPSYIKRAVSSLFLCTPAWTDFFYGQLKILSAWRSWGLQELLWLLHQNLLKAEQTSSDQTWFCHQHSSP